MNMEEANAKLNAWVNGVINFFKNLPQTIKNLPRDEQISWASIATGSILVLVAIIVW